MLQYSIIAILLGTGACVSKVYQIGMDNCYAKQVSLNPVKENYSCVLVLSKVVYLCVDRGV